MRQGASRHAISDRRDDLYEMPAIAVHALMRTGLLGAYPGMIWEPAAGRGAISRVLIADGHPVIASDLVAYDGADAGITSRIDFLMEQEAPKGVSAIVSNPPYKLADAFVRHGLALGLPVIVLLRLMAIEGASRSDLIDRHLRAVWAGIERLPTMHREGWEGPRIAVAGMPFGWFVFEPGDRQGSIALRRMSWRAA
jgi:hypothetical protein